MHTYIYLQQSTLLYVSYIVFIALLGLCLGSFSNVIIMRYPQYLCHTNEKSFWHNISFPRSCCSTCKQQLPWYDLIPILSFVLLHGKSRCCNQPISWKYPIIELCSALFFIYAAFLWVNPIQLSCALLFIFFLINLSWIDINLQLLPDELNLALLWLGLIINSFGIFTQLLFAVWGAIVGYSILWFVGVIYQSIRKKQGMGYGDYKLLAAVGAWVGVQNIGICLLLAVTIALLCGIFLMLAKQLKLDQRIPFGPYIAIAAWITLSYHSSLWALSNRLIN